MDLKSLLPSETDERGVSPVIGVVLMVAITVVLAATIATFVLGLGPGANSTAPTAQFSVSDASADTSPITADDDSPHNMLVVSHDNGDTLDAGSYSVRVKNSSEDQWEGISADEGRTYESDDNSDGEDNVEITTSEDPGSTELSTGDQLVIEISNEELEDDEEFDYAMEWDVQIIHEPSDSTVLDSSAVAN